MKDYFKEVAKGLIAFANLFAVLVFFKSEDWLSGFYVIIGTYIFSGIIYYVLVKKDVT
ncbi:MAG: hypothetical protein Q9M32_05105 [Sulfurimonas sp.]|nr:hypothetical protein [Sulfurimonas sp.]MDQ7060615.1 hypothetical protein [Sulfurimonas sp.]